ncbi:MAG TPA: hypothetical protein VEO54_17190, partial [Thermoanaerobaculia bacterium]|nr:hypothetical protein [Thermoanaerobaculia bacterium]
AQEKLQELEAQTDDLRGALRALRELPYGDDERAAVIAWSYAGESAWRLAQGDARIELVIALDSNVTEGWVYQSREALAAAGSAPRRARFVEFSKRTPEWTGLAHGNFNALEGMIPAVAGIDRVQPWSSAGPKAKSGYERLSRRVGEELETTFRKPRPKAAWVPVALRAADGATVDGELYRAAGDGRSCVALFHQSGSSRGEYRTIGPELARMGYTALAIDVRWGNRDRWHDVRNENAARHGTPEAFERRDQARIGAIKAGERLDLDAASTGFAATAARASSSGGHRFRPTARWSWPRGGPATWPRSSTSRPANMRRTILTA